MNFVGFIFSSLFIGFIGHVFFDRYLTFFGFSPDLIFLLVLSIGFLQGPLLGEVTGFFMGFIADIMGVSLFGLHSFLFSLTGYIAGKMRRRVDSERVPSQIVIAFFGTIIFNWAGSAVRLLMEEAGSRNGFWLVMAQSLLNSILIPFIFYGVVRLSAIWNMPCD